MLPVGFELFLVPSRQVFWLGFGHQEAVVGAPGGCGGFRVEGGGRALLCWDCRGHGFDGVVVVGRTLDEVGGSVSFFLVMVVAGSEMLMSRAEKVSWVDVMDMLPRTNRCCLL